MLRYIFLFIVLVHGLIHLMGFAKAFDYGNITQLSKTVSKPLGAFWLATAILFIIITLLLLLKKDWWWIPALIAIIISQLLIINFWNDAKFGSIANLLILVAVINAWGIQHFENTYKTDVAYGLNSTNTIENNLLTMKDIEPLPELVQRYLTHVGVLNKPKVKNAKVIFEGEMREQGKGWFKFTSEQYNFFDTPTRLFFMKANMFGVTIPGYHAYKNANATMQIKLAGLYPIVNVKGNTLTKAETVTLFNDMCIFAPATLIDKRISWQPVDNSSVKAIFTTEGISITAILYFNKEGELINFISDDRYAVGDMKQYRFSTPVSNYKNISGYNLSTYGETVWHYPEGNFTYGKFNLQQLEYNCK